MIFCEILFGKYSEAHDINALTFKRVDTKSFTRFFPVRLQLFSFPINANLSESKFNSFFSFAHTYPRYVNINLYSMPYHISTE